MKAKFYNTFIRYVQGQVYFSKFDKSTLGMNLNCYIIAQKKEEKKKNFQKFKCFKKIHLVQMFMVKIEKKTQVKILQI